MSQGESLWPQLSSLMAEQLWVLCPSGRGHLVPGRMSLSLIRPPDYYVAHMPYVYVVYYSYSLPYRLHIYLMPHEHLVSLMFGFSCILSVSGVSNTFWPFIPFKCVHYSTTTYRF